jgi:hypothetical protein
MKGRVSEAHGLYVVVLLLLLLQIFEVSKNYCLSLRNENLVLFTFIIDACSLSILRPFL